MITGSLVTPVPPSLVPDPVLECRELTKVYGDGSAAVRALDGVSLAIQKGKLTAVMGASGSGKSTLLHCLAGLDYATSGSVTLEGRELTTMKDRQLTKLRRDSIGFIFQSFNLVPTLSAIANITLPASIAGKQVSPSKLAKIVAAVGLADRLEHKPSELSGGEQQRVACARALVTEPAVVFADEPTGNLDSRSTEQVLSFLRSAAHDMGQTVVMVTHEADAAAWADRVIFLADGRVAAELNSPTRDSVLDALRILGTSEPEVETAQEQPPTPLLIPADDGVRPVVIETVDIEDDDVSFASGVHTGDLPLSPEAALLADRAQEILSRLPGPILDQKNVAE